MVNGKYIFNVHWPNSLGPIEGFCTVCEQPWLDLNPRPFVLKVTTRTTAAGLGCQEDPSSVPTIDVVKASRVCLARTGWGFLNVQGLRHKVHEVRDLVKTQDLEVLGLAETWLISG